MLCGKINGSNATESVVVVFADIDEMLFMLTDSPVSQCYFSVEQLK